MERLGYERYATHGGVHHKVPQVGRVVLEKDEP